MRAPRHRGRRGAPCRAMPLLAVLAACVVTPAAAQTGTGEPVLRLDDAASPLRNLGGGVLGLMGYNMTPDGSTNAVEINTAEPSSGQARFGSRQLVLGQLGFGFTVSESLPVFMEIYLGYARYNPRAMFSGAEANRLPVRWNNVAATIGLGYDIALTETLFLRPIANVSLGYAASDAALFGYWLEHVTGIDASALTGKHMNVWARGGSLALAYYDFRPERDVDIELRYTHLRLETFGNTASFARGTATAETIGLWGRYRWPTGREAFGRDIRWVIDGSASFYLGDQRDAVGFGWSMKVGGGIEFDVGRQEIGAVGLSLKRVRLVARYFLGDGGITGTSIGIGMTF